jgi:hypothetical protein
LVRVTHPFHPWHGRQFEFVSRGHRWGEARVWFYDDEHRLRSLPVTWTDRAVPDPFVVLSAGRSLYRVEDLCRLAAVLRSLAAAGTEAGQP